MEVTSGPALIILVGITLSGDLKDPIRIGVRKLIFHLEGIKDTILSGITAEKR